MDDADEDDETVFQNALGLLTTATNLTPEDFAVANEYGARANYELGNLTQSLTMINSALEAGETANRHYIRGLVLEAQGETDDAIREYEWVLAWSHIYPFTVRVEAQDHLDDLRAEEDA